MVNNTKITLDAINRFYPAYTWQEFLAYNFVQNDEPYKAILRRIINEQAEPLLDEKGNKIN